MNVAISINKIAVSKTVDWIKGVIQDYATRMNSTNLFDATLETVFIVLILMVGFFIIFQCLAALLQSTIDVFKIVGDFLIVALKWGAIFFGIILFLWFFLNPNRQCLFKIEDSITRCIYVEKSKPKPPANPSKKGNAGKTQK